MQSLAGVKLYAADELVAIVPADTYLLDGAATPARLVRHGSLAWPKPGRTANGIEIAFVAGYGNAAAYVPAPIRQAILLLVAHWYEHREPVAIGAGKRLRPVDGLRSASALSLGAPMKPSGIGALRERLTLQSPSRADDGGGGAVVTWNAVAELWAAVRPISGDERLRHDAVTARVTHEVWIRHRADVVPAMRFAAGARILDIVAVLAPDRRDRLQCLCEER